MGSLKNNLVKFKTLHKQIFLLIFIALFLRILNLSFPAFTSGEARIAFRGHLLSTQGVDELGRKFPLLFNSLNDYQMPLTSYITASGTVLLGKSELAARLPFIIFGLVLIILTYKVSTKLSKKRSFHFFSSLLVATSPVLILASKTPNESIVLTVLLLWLFYLIISKNVNLILVLLNIILLLATSKLAWFILAPFVFYTVLTFRNTLDFKKKLQLTLISLFFSVLAFALFLQIPQSIRSLSENNLSLLSDITVKNGINQIRGQGIESDWPPILGQILINKSHFLIVGSLHWLSNLQPAVFFSQFDEKANLGLLNMGTFPKAAIIPALSGILAN